jgi:hypothetical protein
MIVRDFSVRFLTGSPEFDALQIEAEQRDGIGELRCCGGLPDDPELEREMNARFDADPVTEADVDAMWAEEQARREAEAAEVF